MNNSRLATITVSISDANAQTGRQVALNLVLTLTLTGLLLGNVVAAGLALDARPGLRAAGLRRGVAPRIEHQPAHLGTAESEKPPEKRRARR